MRNKFYLWIIKNEVSRERAAIGLGWDLEKTNQLIDYEFFPTYKEIKEIDEYTLGDVKFKHWRKNEFEREYRKQQRKKKKQAKKAKVGGHCSVLGSGEVVPSNSCRSVE